MTKLKLSQLLPTLPRYINNLSKGPYKNGNYARVTLVTPFDGLNKSGTREYDANDFPKELLERPWYVIRIIPYVRSCHRNTGTAGVRVLLAKEGFENEIKF